MFSQVFEMGWDDRAAAGAHTIASVDKADDSGAQFRMGLHV